MHPKWPEICISGQSKTKAAFSIQAVFALCNTKYGLEFISLLSIPRDSGAAECAAGVAADHRTLTCFSRELFASFTGRECRRACKTVLCLLVVHRFGPVGGSARHVGTSSHLCGRAQPADEWRREFRPDSHVSRSRHVAALQSQEIQNGLSRCSLTSKREPSLAAYCRIIVTGSSSTVTRTRYRQCQNGRSFFVFVFSMRSSRSLGWKLHCSPT